MPRPSRQLTFERGHLRWWVPAAGLLAVASLWVRESHTYRVTLHPGQPQTLLIETPMQRFWEHKSYAQEPGLPVGCRVFSPNNAPGGLDVRVIGTGHRLHHLWARLAIHPGVGVTPGKHARTAEFTINQQGGWPRVTVIINIRASP